MKSTPTPHIATGVTAETLSLTFGASGRFQYDVVVPAGTRCKKLDGGSEPWGVDDLGFIEDKSRSKNETFRTTPYWENKMAMLITSIAHIKEQTSEDGFKLFCTEQGIDPNNYDEPEEGVCVDKMDLYRYDAQDAAQDLAASVKAFKRSSGMSR